MNMEDSTSGPCALPLWIALAGVFLLCGCSTVGNQNIGKGLLGAARITPANIRSRTDEAALHKKAEADSFPTAAEAGM